MTTINLNYYTNATETILHDFSGAFYGSPFDMTAAINRARRRVAELGQCVRFIPAIGGILANPIIVSPGSGYTSNPTLAISGPDVTGGVAASGTLVAMGGVITGFTLSPGSGYINPPTFTISGGGGTGGVVSADAGSLAMSTIESQEIYTFADINSVIDQQAGVGAITNLGYINQGVGNIIAVNSIAVSWGTTKPVLQRWAWQELQAYGRAVQNTFQNYPYVWAQYGQGDLGSVYMWPIPSGSYQMDWDCICTVLDLNSNSDPEAIPPLWSEPVPYYAAYLAYQYAQRNEDAREMFNEYVRKMNQARANSEPPFIPDMYGTGYYG